MPILTKPNSISKGSPANVTLDKSLLALVSLVSNDTYFNDTTNWAFVEINYKSSTGKQKISVKFDCAESTPASTFITSSKARDIFNIDHILIRDFDGGSLYIPSSSVNASEFQFDFTPAPAAQGISWTARNGASESALSFVANGGINCSNGAAWTIQAYGGVIGSSTNFEILYTIPAHVSGTGNMYGFSRLAFPNANTYISDGFYQQNATGGNLYEDLFIAGGNNPWTTANSYPKTFKIVRTGGNTITYYVDNVQKQQITYSGAVYPHVVFGTTGATSITSATVELT